MKKLFNQIRAMYLIPTKEENREMESMRQLIKSENIDDVRNAYYKMAMMYTRYKAFYDMLLFALRQSKKKGN